MVYFDERIYTWEYRAASSICVNLCWSLRMGCSEIRLKISNTISKATTNKFGKLYVIHRNSFHLLGNRPHSYGATIIKMVPEMLLNVTIPNRSNWTSITVAVQCKKKPEAGDHFRKFTSRGFWSPLFPFWFFFQPFSIQPFRLKEAKKPYASWTNYEVRCTGDHLFSHTFKINTVWWVVVVAAQHFNHLVDRHTGVYVSHETKYIIIKYLLKDFFHSCFFFAAVHCLLTLLGVCSLVIGISFSLFPEKKVISVQFYRA